MNFELHFRDTFEAGHVIADDPDCGKFHGHTWTVDVYLDWRAFSDTEATPILFRAHLSAQLLELNGRFLNDMIKPSEPTAQGVASWLHGRLALTYEVTRISVQMGNLVGAELTV